jgi:hypothetical protein
MRPIIGPQHAGQGFRIGIKLGPQAHLIRQARGGLTVYFEWFDNDRNELGRGEPTLFIARTARFALSGNRGSVAIPMQHAHQHADSKTGAPTAYLIAFAARGCVELGLEPSRDNVRMLADAIVDNLPDLIKMPPEPHPDAFASAKSKPLGVIEVKADGKVVAEEEIR